MGPSPDKTDSPPARAAPGFLRGGGCGEKFRSKPFPIYPNRDARAPPGFERRAATSFRVPERRRRAGREKYKVPYPKAEKRRPRAAKLMGRVSQRRNPRRARTSRVRAARRHVIPRAGAPPARRRGSSQDDEPDHARRVAARAGGRLATD